MVTEGVGLGPREMVRVGPAGWADPTARQRGVSPGSGDRPGGQIRPTRVGRGGVPMRARAGATLLVAAGATACGGDDQATPEAPDTPPSSEPEPEEPLRRPKPDVPLTPTPPPIKPAGGPPGPTPSTGYITRRASTTLA